MTDASEMDADARAQRALEGPADEGSLDEALTDCVARAFSLRAEILRLSRRRDALLRADPAESKEAALVAARIERLHQRWESLVELTASVRRRRDAVPRG